MGKVYFSSTTRIDDRNLDVFGAIENATSFFVRKTFLDKTNWWCLDSGTFSKPFVEKIWKERVLAYKPYISKCKFVVVPDVVYNYRRTLTRFYKYYEFVKENGFPCAFVTQDGIPVSKIPFDKLDVLFVGGSNDHKLGRQAQRCIAAAKERNVWVHVGRVNSLKRIKIFSDCNSWDGTHLGFYPADGDKFAELIRQLDKENNNND